MILPTLPHCDIPAFVAHYNVRAYGMTVAKSTRELSISGDQYHFDTNIKSDVIFYSDKMAYDSLGTFDQGVLMPDHFTYRRDHKNQRSNIQFDWKAMIAQSMKNGEKATVKIVPGTQDFISSQLLLRELLLKHSKVLSYHLVKSNKLQTYHFTILGQKTIRTSLGKIPTVELERVDGSRVTDFWLDPSAGYLLIQSVQKKDGAKQARVYLTDYRLSKGCLYKASSL